MGRSTADTLARASRNSAARAAAIAEGKAISPGGPFQGDGEGGGEWMDQSAFDDAVAHRRAGLPYYMVNNQGEVVRDSFTERALDAVIESGGTTPQDYSAKIEELNPLKNGMSLLEAVALFGGMATGISALGGGASLFGGAGAAAGGAGTAGAGTAGFGAAGSITPEMAAWGLGEAVPTAGGFLGADSVAALTGGATGAAGLSGSGIGGVLSDQAIGNALMAGEYGGMTGSLTATEAYNAVIAGGGTAAEAATAAASVGSGIGSGSTSLLNNLGMGDLLGGLTGGSGGGTGGSNLLSSLIGGGSNISNLLNTGLSLYGQHQAGQSAQDTANQNAALQKPWLDAGTNALSQLTAGTQPGGEFRKDYTVADYQVDPYNKWLQNQGNQAIQRSAAAKGTLNSGNVLAELSKYNQNQAGAGFADQWNRNQQNTTNQFNRLGTIAGLGPTAADNVMSGNAFAASEASKSKLGMTNTLSNLINSWG